MAATGGLEDHKGMAMDTINNHLHYSKSFGMGLFESTRKLVTWGLSFVTVAGYFTLDQRKLGVPSARGLVTRGLRLLLLF